MGDPLLLTRNDFLKTCGALTAGAVFGRPLLAADNPGISQEPVYLDRPATARTGLARNLPD